MRPRELEVVRQQVESGSVIVRPMTGEAAAGIDRVPSTPSEPTDGEHARARGACRQNSTAASALDGRQPSVGHAWVRP